MMKVEELIAELRVIAKYGSALAVLGWDEEVNLPKKGHQYRGEINALLSSDLHKRIINQKLYDQILFLNEQKQFDKLNKDHQVIVRESKKDVELARKLPASFVEEISLLTTQAFSAWVEARAKKDFTIFAPVLSKVIKMKIQEAQLIGYEESPYDALLDEYEPGMTTAKIDRIFRPLSASLARLIASAAGTESCDLAPAKYPLQEQVKLNTLIAKKLGYDLDAGRIDVSPHPFTTTFHTSDVRITTRYDETDFWVSLGSTIHEVGHALYEQGLPVEHFGNPLGEAVSLGIHESQSRSWENFVGRSKAFSNYLHPLLKKHFPQIEYSAAELYKWLNKVSPSLVRVESDEVTYNLHIVLRYELEKALIEGDLTVKDLPAAWNEKMKNYLNLEVPDSSMGVLQDVHWSHGSFGYFPTYTLGNIYGAQFHNTAKKQLPGLEEDFAKGEFSAYLKWLRDNIHIHGRRYSPIELVEKVTGEDINSKYLLNHLSEKVDQLKI